MRELMKFLVAASLVASSASFAAVPTDGVHEYSLRNGLKLIVKEDHRAPVVVSQVWYRVGSAYEKRGGTGISHVVEHMMFKGTKTIGKGEFSKIVALNGGQHNAFTSDDYTGYYQIFEADKLKISFQLESDRMQNLILDPKEFAKEIQVVMEERRMRTDDNPHSKTYERFQAAAFVSSPYHHPVVGWMDDLENMTVNDVRDWYNAWYGPNNAIVVVVGDVKPAEVYDLAKKYFGPIKPKKLPTLKAMRDVELIGERNITVKAPAKLPWIVLGYNTPSVKTAKEAWEPYALEVLVGVLDRGDSARLSREVVRKNQVATSAQASYSLFSLFDGLLTLSGTPTAQHSVADLQASLIQQVKNLQTQLVSPQELNRVKAQVIASRIFDKDSMEQQAMEIGMLESLGLSWHVADNYASNVEKVTAEQVQQVAKKYLISDRLTTAVLDPQPLDSEKPTQNLPAGGHHDR